MRKTTQILTTTGLFIIGLTAAAVLVERCDPTKPKPLEVQHPNPAKTYQQLQQIGNPDSADEQTKQWRGLCAKNSVKTIDDFRKVIADDPVLSDHFLRINYKTLTIKKTDRPTQAVVYHRSNAVLAPTSKPISIPAGDPYITDGEVKIRMQCCNDYIELLPPAAGPPPKLEIPPEFVTPGLPPVEAAPPVAETSPPPTYYGRPNTVTHHFHGEGTPAPVPEPSTILMFGAGLGLLSFFGRRK